MDSRSSLTSTSISARYMEKRTTRKKRIGRNMIDDDLVNFLGMIDPNRIDILIKPSTAGSIFGSIDV